MFITKTKKYIVALFVFLALPALAATDCHEDSAVQQCIKNTPIGSEDIKYSFHSISPLGIIPSGKIFECRYKFSRIKFDPVYETIGGHGSAFVPTCQNCQAGQAKKYTLSYAWLNNSTGFLVPHVPSTPLCDGGCEVTVAADRNSRPSGTKPAGTPDFWRLLMDDFSGATTGKECFGELPKTPPFPQSPPGMNCGFYNGEEVCVGKDNTYVCREVNGVKECLPTSDINNGQVCGMVQGKYMCFPLGPDANLCSPNARGEMVCLPKGNIYPEPDPKDPNKPKDPASSTTDGDKAGTTDSDKDTATTSGSKSSAGWGNKYEHGIGGVWMVKSKELQNSQLSQMAGRLLPSYNSGQCPSWMVDMNISGLGDFGIHDIAPPCWVWSALRAVILVMASIFAFRLVFGGA